MTKYQSELKTTFSSCEVVFGLLSDLENIRPLMEKSGREMPDLQIEQERIVLNIPSIGIAGFELTRKEPYQYIEFKSFDIPVSITASIRLQEIGKNMTLMQLFLEGDFPPVIAMMLVPKIKSGIGKMADAIAVAINQKSSNS